MAVLDGSDWRRRPGSRPPTESRACVGIRDPCFARRPPTRPRTSSPVSDERAPRRPELIGRPAIAVEALFEGDDPLVCVVVRGEDAQKHRGAGTKLGLVDAAHDRSSYESNQVLDVAEGATPAHPCGDAI